MVRSNRLALALPVVALALASLRASVAAAQGRPALIHHDEAVLELADPSEAKLAELAEAGSDQRPAVGLVYARFAVFQIDFARWNPRYAVYVDDGEGGFEYEVASAAELAELTGVDEDAIRTPLRFYFPPGAVFVGLFLFVGVPVYRTTTFARRRRRSALMQECRYQTATAKYHGNWDAPPDERLAEAIEILTSQGVSARIARRNLVFLCGIED